MVVNNDDGNRVLSVNLITIYLNNFYQEYTIIHKN